MTQDPEGVSEARFNNQPLELPARSRVVAFNPDHAVMYANCVRCINTDAPRRKPTTGAGEACRPIGKTRLREP